MQERSSLISRLVMGERITERVALVVAHPDDEAVGIGSRLALFDDLTLIHLTDGAPSDPGYASRAGFADNIAYAAARRAELDAALVALDAHPARRLAYGLVDQRTHDKMQMLITRLAHDLRNHAAVITHAYEHGHPDHDTAAFSVARACDRIGGFAPARYEFAGYFRSGDHVRYGDFHPEPGVHETRLPIGVEGLAAKRAAFAAHRSQAGTLAQFDPGRETMRPAPDYNFTAPASPRTAVHDLWHFELSPEAWRAAAAPLAMEQFQHA